MFDAQTGYGLLSAAACFIVLGGLWCLVAFDGRSLSREQHRRRLYALYEPIAIEHARRQVEASQAVIRG